MPESKPAEEHLFRQFRRGWMPVWLDDFRQQSGPLLQLFLIAATVVFCSWAALTYLPRSTGQEVASVESWRRRIDDAEAKELVPVFQSLFQVKNDRVIDLGINYMLSADPEHRDAARNALEDSLTVWKQWDDDEASGHIYRVADSLARQVRMFNAPEQATAVEVARQFLLWPTANRDNHSELLLSCETIFRDARSAFTDGPLERPESAPVLETNISAADQVAASLLDEGPTTFVASSSKPQVFGAGYRRPGRSATLANNANSNSGSVYTEDDYSDSPYANASSSASPKPSQVPMIDEEGNSVGVRSIDPSTLNLPGGLIPVQLSGERKQAPIIDEPEESIALGPPETVAEVIERRNQASPEIVPGESEAVRDFEDQSPPIPAEPRRLVESLPSSTLDRQARPLRETMQRNRILDDLANSTINDAVLDAVPGREPLAWQPPKKPLRRWAHIDVMKLLQSDSDADVETAELELTRRGFDRSYISVAYRLTSEDPLDRYNLVFELTEQRQVEPLPFLKWLSEDAHPEVRSAAVEQLNRLVGNDIR